MESISSGMNFLKRRFSSQDMGDEEKPSAPPAAPSVAANGPPPPPPPSTGFSLAGIANKVSSTISAPTSPSKPTQSVYSQVQGLTKNLMQAASSGLSSSHPQGPHKCILIVDDHHIDWSKYFRNNRTGWQLRIEQAPFSDIHVCCFSDKECCVEIKASANKERRTFQPDFVLFRQAARSEKGDFSNVAVTLLKAGVQTLNSAETTMLFLNKHWMFCHLQRLAAVSGPGVFPIIEQTYYPSFDHFTIPAAFPVVVRTQHGTQGIGKMKIDDEHHLLELEGIIRSLKRAEVIVEQYIDTKYDIHIQKIGSETKAFIRKGISNNWKSNTGSAMLEQIALTNRHKQWLHLVSDAFGGMEVLGLDILVAKDGREIVHDANDVLTFLGDSQEDDRRAISDLIQLRIANWGAQRAASVASRGAAQQANGPPPPPPPRPASSNVSRSSTMEKNIAGGMNGNEALQRRGSRDQPAAANQPPRPTRQPSTSGKEPTGATFQDDTMGQLKRTFAGIFGDV